MRYQDKNAQAVDRWVDSGWQWGIPVTHEEYLSAAAGHWNVLLTPVKPVPHEWFGELSDKHVLGLAAGGGQQMPIFAALGAKCTVLDFSRRQIESELLVAAREGYEINAVRADMTQRLPFESEFFDLIFHPVSNVYAQDVLHIWRECFRVLKSGGVLLSGLDNGLNYAFDDSQTSLINTLPFNPLLYPEQMARLEADDGGIQFSHTIEEQIGGQIAAGFRLTDIYGDTDGSGNLHRHNVPTYWATRAIKEG